MSAIIRANRGSDVSFQMNWPNGEGGNADLTGYTARSYDVSGSAAFLPEVTLTDAATGLIDLFIPWQDDMPNVIHHFRIQIQNTDGVDQATNRISVQYT